MDNKKEVQMVCEVVLDADGNKLWIILECKDEVSIEGETALKGYPLGFPPAEDFQVGYQHTGSIVLGTMEVTKNHNIKRNLIP